MRDGPQAQCVHRFVVKMRQGNALATAESDGSLR